MENQKIFVSYSRTDSDFAVKFTSDLKKAGADIWLDKLDIRLAEKWDIEIEKALEACHSLFFIVSQASVSSDNVLNEVYFALEAGKKVYPIIKEECKMPFRLRRLQYVDLSQDYEQGLNQLLVELGLRSKTEQPAFTNGTGSKGPVNNKRRYFLIGGGILALVIISLVIWKISSSGNSNASKEEDAEKENIAIYDTAAVDAMYDSALFYEKEKDFVTAFDWYKQIEESGDPHGSYNVGFFYEFGQGVEENFDSAFVYYKKAADNGDVDGMISLSDCYKEGVGVEQDLLKADEWLKKAGEAKKKEASQQE